MTTQLALRILELQKEFNLADEVDSAAAQFHKPEWAARSRTEIAADYADALRAFAAATGD
jgi:hypothetical protein